MKRYVYADARCLIGGAMPERLAATIRIPVAVSLGCFLAWKEALVAFLCPVSQSLIFSPYVCQSLAGCLVLVIALVGVARNRAGFTPRNLSILAGVLVALATVAGACVSAHIAGSVMAYVGAVVIGATSAGLLYAWAEVLAALDVRQRIGTAVAAVFLCSVIGVLVGQCGGLLMRTIVALLGVATALGFVIMASRSMDHVQKPLVIRPGSSNHFRLLLLAIVLYAFVFGVSGGTTAAQASEDSTRTFMLGTSWAMVWVSAAMVGGLLLWRRPVRLSTVGRFLTPVLALLFLLHILLQGSVNGWLPRLTAGFWQLVQVFVVLLLIDVARSGLASLSFTFPLGWSIVSLGFTAGALFGQVAAVTFGPETEAVNAITVSLTIVAVIASSILAAAQYPKAAPEASWVAVPAIAETAAEALGVPVADPIGDACRELVGRYGLSEREQSVLELLARGNTRASIAEKLCISENTVRVHVKNIYAKMHIHSKQQLIDMVDKLVG